MKKKILWVLLSFLLVAALVLVACGEAAPGEQEEEEEEEVVVPAEGEPQYGGTLTVWRNQQADPPTPDRMASATSAPHFWLQVFQEHPLMGNFEKYGPRGTGEIAFQVRGYIPETYMRGCLLESWEVSPEKVVWRVRPEIYWHGNKPDVMESRELVADDMVAWLLRIKQSPAGVTFSKMAGDIYATDRYTLEIEFSKGYDYTLMYLVGYEDRTTVEPPETVAAGAEKWANHVGTGPFMNTEYVVGSHYRYERNPNYWDTTTINGKEYQIPFVDEIITPIIPDESTRIAALRTGVLDWFAEVPPAHWDSLDKTAPGLLSAKVLAANGFVVALKVNKPPFNSYDVRKALMIGTDMKEFNDMLGVPFKLPIDWHPLYPGDPATYIPLDELPAESRLLYDYNPTLAKQLLADAGYPDGFKMEVITQSAPMAVDRASLLEAQWGKIGVEVKVKVTDPTTYVGHRYKPFPFQDALITVVETPGPVFVLTRTALTDAVLNPAEYSDPEMDELIGRIIAEADVDARNLLTKEAGLKLLTDIPYVPLQATPEGYFWWPWIKNYWGEFNVGDARQPEPLWARMWLDQDLKVEMGY